MNFTPTGMLEGRIVTMAALLAGALGCGGATAPSEVSRQGRAIEDSLCSAMTPSISFETLSALAGSGEPDTYIVRTDHDVICEGEVETLEITKAISFKRHQNDPGVALKVETLLFHDELELPDGHAVLHVPRDKFGIYTVCTSGVYNDSVPIAPKCNSITYSPELTCFGFKGNGCGTTGPLGTVAACGTNAAWVPAGNGCFFASVVEGQSVGIFHPDDSRQGPVPIYNATDLSFFLGAAPGDTCEGCLYPNQ
jgi:hypothetical protein